MIDTEDHMRIAFAVVLLFGMLLSPSSHVHAQTFFLPGEVSTSIDLSPASPAYHAYSCERPRLWGSVEYLRWWMKDSSSPPLVAAGNPADPVPGAVGQPGTSVLFGGNQGFPNLNGMRLTLGGWFCGSNLGWEVAGFGFDRLNVGFATGSNASGTPALYVPIFRPDLGREGSVTVAQPLDPITGLGFNGNIAIASQSRLWGAEANFVYDLLHVPGRRFELLAGFRYLDLQESVTMNTYRNDFGFDIQNSIQDSFATRSQFYGGQLGARAGMSWGPLSALVTGKVALGSTHQTVNIDGSDTVSGTGFGPTTTFKEGIFTQASNIGHFSRNDFTVVPQVQLQLAYDVRPWLQLTAGYDFLYWSRVVRAADQIDHNVNLTQSNFFSLNPPASASAPAPSLNRNGFWAQGVTFGVQFRY